MVFFYFMGRNFFNVKIQWNLYKADTIGAKKVSFLSKCPLYRDFF